MKPDHSLVGILELDQCSTENRLTMSLVNLQSSLRGDLYRRRSLVFESVPLLFGWVPESGIVYGGDV
jgi:hypothetical protein